LDVLHDAIQYSMGWTDSHMHQFEKNRVFYGIDDDDFGFDIENERKFSLKDLLRTEKDSMNYCFASDGIGQTRC